MVVMMAHGDHPDAPDRVAMAIVVGDVALDVSRAAARAVVFHVGPRGAVVPAGFRSGSGEEDDGSKSEERDQVLHNFVLGFTRSDEVLRCLFKKSGNFFGTSVGHDSKRFGHFPWRVARVNGMLPVNVQPTLSR